MSDHSVQCAHCSLPVPGGLPDLDAPQFCCPGCRTVYAMLSDAGLEGYYAARDAAEASALGPASAAEAGRYAHYDTPEFLARFAPDGDEIELHVEGAHCAACVWLMDRLPEVEPGAREARLDLGRSRLRLRWNPEISSLSSIAERLHTLGYRTTPLGAEAEQARRIQRRSEVLRLGLMGAVALNASAVAAALYAGDAFGDMSPRFQRFLGWIAMGLAVPAVTYGALPFYRSAIAGLRMRMAHIDLPISLGVLGSFLASVYATLSGSGLVYYDSVTALVFLLLLGRFVQQGGQRAAMSRAELLVSMTPGSARKRIADEWVDVPANTLQPGDRVQAQAGERIPVDGAVIHGEGHVDRSLLTGEDRPVPVGPGDPVHAGTVSVGGELEIEALTVGESTRLGRLVQQVDAAGSERAPIARLADRISGYFVLTVLGLALAGAVGWAFVDPERIFEVVVSLLVVTCPCALGMATPVALAVGRGRAAAAGVLVRSTAGLERLARVQTVFFDKTGTVTEGRMSVQEAWLTEAALKGALKGAIGSLELNSTHPIAHAIATWAGAEADGISTTEFMQTAGKGVSGVVGGRRLQLGAPGHLDAGEYAPQLASLLAHGLTPVVCHVDGVPHGVLGLGDAIRPDAAQAVKRLQSMGLRVGLLSGDHPETVRSVAAKLGVDFSHGAQSPEQKAQIVAEAPNSAMVGDGFNDAAALRTATVGVAVHGGAEIAAQVADIYLARSGPMAFVQALHGARRTLGVIHRNLLFSLAYNVLFAGLALAGLISPLAAAVLMPISSLTVILHSVSARLFVEESAPASTLG